MDGKVTDFEQGVGSSADILTLTVVISMACFLLVEGLPSQDENMYSGYAERATQNTLLALQRVSVAKFGNFSYSPTFPISNPSERKLRRKTMTQLIAEDVLLNPTWKEGKLLVESERNYKFSEELEKFLGSSLDKFVGQRFGYRLTIWMDPIQLSGNKHLVYRKVIEKLDDGSEKLCSETISMDVSIPRSWLKGGSKVPNLGDYGSKELSKPLMPNFVESGIKKIPNSSMMPVGKLGVVNLTLELWSR